MPVQLELQPIVEFLQSEIEDKKDVLAAIGRGEIRHLAPTEENLEEWDEDVEDWDPTQFVHDSAIEHITELQQTIFSLSELIKNLESGNYKPLIEYFKQEQEAHDEARRLLAPHNPQYSAVFLEKMAAECSRRRRFIALLEAAQKDT